MDLRVFLGGVLWSGREGMGRGLIVRWVREEVRWFYGGFSREGSQNIIVLFYF
jgi:hypothetical protein